jgi:hypothetical protein
MPINTTRVTSRTIVLLDRILQLPTGVKVIDSVSDVMCRGIIDNKTVSYSSASRACGSSQCLDPPAEDHHLALQFVQACRKLRFGDSSTLAGVVQDQ